MSREPGPVHVVGGGLAGSECAWQLAARGVPVVLHEMRPVRPTPAHKTGDLAELVCSNSLRSDDPLHAAGLLKREMEAFGSLVIGTARDARGAGRAAPWRSTATASRPAVTGAHRRPSAASSSGARRSPALPPRGRRRPRHRPAHLGRPWRASLQRPAGQRLPLLLRRHRADRGGRQPRHLASSSGSRATARATATTT